MIEKEGGKYCPWSKFKSLNAFSAKRRTSGANQKNFEAWIIFRVRSPSIVRYGNPKAIHLYSEIKELQFNQTKKKAKEP
jgi:hypothetical protein